MLRKLLFTASISLGVVSAETLTVTKVGTGTGSVISSPSGINCGSTCSASFSNGTNVVLQAIPDAGSVFSGWGSDCNTCGNSSTCPVTMNSDKNCVAGFFSVRPAPPISNPPPTPPNVDPAYTRLVNTPAGSIRLEASSQITNLVQRSASFSPPAGFAATYGVIEFSLNTNIGYETVRLIFPRPIPPGSKILKEAGGTLYDITSQADIRGSVVAFVVHDNSWMDVDSTPNAIRDPIVLLENISSSAGGGGCSTGAGAGWFGLAVVALLGLFRRLRNS